MTLPPNPPPIPYQPQAQPVDTSALDVLGVFYYVLACLYLVGGFIPFLYVLFGIFVGVSGAANADNAEQAHGMAAFGGFMACIGIFFGALFWILSFLYFLTGGGLRNRKRLTLCYVMAGLVCLVFPLGTVLGVFTFVCLSKPGMKAMFA